MHAGGTVAGGGGGGGGSDLMEVRKDNFVNFVPSLINHDLIKK
jgi:hypothetical protein